MPNENTGNAPTEMPPGAMPKAAQLKPVPPSEITIGERVGRFVALRQQIAEQLKQQETDLLEAYDRDVLACHADFKKRCEHEYTRLVRTRDKELAELAEQRERELAELRIMLARV